MDSNSHEEITEESDYKIESNSAPVIPRLKEYRIQIPSFRERLLEHQRSMRKRRFFDFLKARPSLAWIKNIRFSSPLAVFRRAANRREAISLGVPSPAGVRRRFHIHFIRKINFSSLLTISKEWLSHPMNAALLLWLICVAASGAMLGLLMLGLLNEAFPQKALRNRWIEINNQILNALFTLMSIYQHPVVFHHLYILCRWRSEDIIELRKIYCKNGAHRPNEWAHMMVVIILLHITCIAQYALCAVYWSFTKSNRPEVLENLLIALGVATPVFAGVYAIYSPLGREYEYNFDEELQRSMKVGLKLSNGQRVLVSEPEWIGGLFDCFSDVPVAYLSCCCTFCVFGWNMERLGFGNMYVHIVTFLLLCLAPFWIFNISAMKIHDNVIGDALGISGIVLCVFGLIYGGFWRIQMRKRFKLPESRFCCGSASLSDYMKWMFCWSCALAQEVRTGNFYDVEDDSLFRRPSDDEKQPFLNSFMSESGSSSAVSISCEANLENPNVVKAEEINTSLVDPNAGNEAIHSLVKVESLNQEESLVVSTVDMMAPPVQPLMKVEDEGEEESTSLVVRDGADEPVMPLVNVEDGMTNVEKGSFVRMMEFGFLFVVVIMYTMGSIIIH
ncbi:uncharacterized protein LOC110018637 [Phalaenopsis equestris]|uniref:uncharacterized protein LOC110018637 n=1 Tax=Phalaenopsis equestris TaxID=78828 RepID=UPI0009E646FA|nr:uncharacterized protein LOC110018637 [Phalaenopsis equestris]